MATLPKRRLLQRRDMQIFNALDRSPLTALQLFRLSDTFSEPFTSLRRVQDRLRKLCEAGHLRSWWYVSPGITGPGGNSQYFKLTPETYRLLHGSDAAPRSKRFFTPVTLSRQEHTKSLADFIVHTLSAAHYRGLNVTEFHGEDRLRIDVAGATFFPDAAFQLVTPAGYRFNFHAELDCSTETVDSHKSHVENWRRRIRRYALHHKYTGKRERLLVVTTGSIERLRNIMRLADEMTRDLDFTLIYGTRLVDFLTAPDALFSRSCFHAPSMHRVSLLGHLGRMEQPQQPFLKALVTPQCA